MGTGNQYEVVWPSGRALVVGTREAPRPNDFPTATVGFLWTNNFRGDEMFSILQQEFAKRYPRMRFVDHSRFGNIHGADEQQVIERLPHLLRAHEVDAVIVGVGA